VKQLALSVGLRSEAVFASFWPGANTEIVSALRMPGSSPLWLWGAQGSGKTHLLQAVCAAAGEAAAAVTAAANDSAAADSSAARTSTANMSAAGTPAAGTPAAYFPLDRSLALPPEALTGFETSSVLCVDDVDAVAGDLAWERALFRLFNDAAELRTRLVFAATVPPRQADWSLEDWGSRAAACVVYHLRELDDEGRVEALRLRAAQRGLQLPHETSEYLLKRMPRDLPSLFDVFDQLDEASLVAQRRLTIPFIRDALEKHAKTKS
jgi:DnaA family protein